MGYSLKKGPLFQEDEVLKGALINKRSCMKVPQKYIFLALGLVILFIVVLHRLSKKAVVPAYEQEEKAKNYVDEKDPITGV